MAAERPPRSRPGFEMAAEGPPRSRAGFAAFLLRSLVQDHCFVDGNKRVAWLAALDVLALGANLTLGVDEEEAANFVLRVADGTTRSIPEIAAWLAERLIPWSDGGADQHGRA
jgi:hypothetical protein